ncbi:hypothetical protein AB1K89_14400, partial [Sporosarcina sp. 179-K 8C2 HS]|uniref:hypothetical protein n=1 Tax=Sporosarcina sp. 179-K 8C2 HS TaxID=3142387 RepID=UPI0039A24F84
MNKHKRWAGYAVLSTAAFAATVGTPAIVAHADVYFAEGTKVTGNFIITKPVELTTSNPEALSDAKVIIDPVDAGAEIDLKAVKITNIEIRGSVKLKSGALDGANIVLNPSNSDAKIDLTGTNAMTVEVKSLVNEIKVPNGAVVTAPKEIAGELEGKVKNAKGDKVVVKEESDQTVPTDAVKVASAKSTIEGLNISWNTDVATTVVSANIAIENATLPEGVTAVVAEGTDSNAGKVVITITSGTESDTIVISAAVPTESIEAVNNAKDVTSLRGAIATHWKALGISEDIKNNFMSLPEGAGRQLAVYQFVKATGTFTDASTLKETFEYAVNQEFHKYEFIKAVDGAKDVNEM